MKQSLMQFNDNLIFINNRNDINKEIVDKKKWKVDLKKYYLIIIIYSKKFHLINTNISNFYFSFCHEGV